MSLLILQDFAAAVVKSPPMIADPCSYPPPNLNPLPINLTRRLMNQVHDPPLVSNMRDARGQLQHISKLIPR